MKRSKLREQTIGETFKREESFKSKDSALPAKESAYRLEVVTEFLKAGIPNAKTDMLRSTVREKRISTYWKFESRTVCFHGFETANWTAQARIRTARTSWLDKGHFRTFQRQHKTREGNCDNSSIHGQWLEHYSAACAIEVCSKSVNANQLAQVLNQCLSVEYGVRGNSLLAAMRDGASVNQAALNIVSFIFPNMVNVVCFSHTLDNVGNHFATLKEFDSLWIRMFRNSCKRSCYGKIWRVEHRHLTAKLDDGRSRWEVYRQLMVQFGDLERYMEEATDAKICPQVLPQLQDILSDPEQHMLLSRKLNGGTGKRSDFLDGLRR